MIRLASPQKCSSKYMRNEADSRKANRALAWMAGATAL
jgi:hypothetical protein